MASSAPVLAQPVSAQAVTGQSLAGQSVAGQSVAGQSVAGSAVLGSALSFSEIIRQLGGWRELGVPLAVLGIVLAMIVPMPPLLLDLLISANIAMSVIVLMVSMYIRQPVDFSVFPTTLLLMTLFRLSLNISSSRLILLHGAAGTAAAGGVIEAFGNFVVGGNFIIGVVIFLVLIAIQYVVINHGAVRISEVSARFTLDALPGKQMSIDADLNAGLIDESEARGRRKHLAAEAEFYGSMDGASRFTQRDAVASILITIINILAGVLIGVLQNGMEPLRALETYAVLTIGDGLVTVIPALMISVSGAMIVTRATSDNLLGAEVQRQIFANPQPLMLAAGVLLAMAVFPGLPKIPFLVLGGGLGSIAWRMRQAIASAEKVAPAEAAPAAPAKENLEALLKVEPLAVEVGLGLVRLVEGGAQSPLLRRIAGIRRQLVNDLGYLLPPVRVTDNVAYKAREYVVHLKGVEVARYEIPAGCDLALAPTALGPAAAKRALGAGGAGAVGAGVVGVGAVGAGAVGGPGARAAGEAPPAPPAGGTPTQEPAFGLPAWWVPTGAADAARRSGFTIVDAPSVIGTHLAELSRRFAHEMFSRQDAKKFLDRAAEENPKAVEDLVPKLLPLSTVQRVLQNLLRERVSIRDSGSILEALSEAANISRNPVLLTEYVRQSIRRTIVKPLLTPGLELPAWFLDPALEHELAGAVQHGEHASHLNLPPQRARAVIDRVARISPSPDAPAVLLTGSEIRFFVRQLTEAALVNVTVIAHGEVPPGVRAVSLGMC